MSVVKEQASLEGFGPAPEATDRLFLAVFPDEAAAVQIAQLAPRLRAQFGLTGKPLLKDRFHVTLHHLGDHAGLRHDIVAAVAEMARAVAVPAFEVTFDRVSSFSRRPKNRPFVLRGDEGVALLVAFQQAIGAAMKRTTLARWAEAGFTPHVTLLYDDRAVQEQAVEPVSWMVREFVLVHSLIGQTRHIVLGRWPLRGEA